MLFGVLVLEYPYNAWMVMYFTMYYGYRYVRPIVLWPAGVEIAYSMIQKFPYFRKQQVIFDGTPPIKPDSKILLAVHPHGILTCSW